MNQEILTMIVKLVLAIVSVLITGYLIPWLNSKIESTKYNDLLTLVEKCVQAAEKIYSQEEWNQKKNYVFELTSTYAQEHGIDITPEELNAIVEGWVKEIKG